MPGIELKNVTKTFGPATVIDNVSLNDAVGVKFNGGGAAFV